MGNKMGIQWPDLGYVWIDWTSGRRERVKAKAGFWLEHLNGEDINPGSRARGSGRGRLGGKSRGWILMLRNPWCYQPSLGRCPKGSWTGVWNSKERSGLEIHIWELEKENINTMKLEEITKGVSDYYRTESTIQLESLSMLVLQVRGMRSNP